MSEHGEGSGLQDDWGDLDAVPAKKGGLPKWAWFCGGGCLVTVVLLVIAAIWGMNFFQKAMDPEVQWPALAEVIPFDERVEDTTIMRMPVPGMTMFMIMGQSEEEVSVGTETDGEELATAFTTQPWMAMFMVLPVGSDEADEIGSLFDPDFTGEAMGMGGRKDVVVGTSTVQGRELRSATYTQIGGVSFIPGSQGDDANSQVMLLDLTEVGEAEPLMLMYMKPGATEPVSLDEVVEFLTPFHVGPVR